MKNMFSQQIISRYKSLISTVYYRSPVVLLKFSKADNDTSFSSSRRFEIFSDAIFLPKHRPKIMNNNNNNINIIFTEA